MKYRIQEYRGKFTIEVKTREVVRWFPYRTEPVWVAADMFGRPISQAPTMEARIFRRPARFDTLEEAKSYLKGIIDGPKHHEPQTETN